MQLKLDMMQTVALALVVYYFGAWVKTKISVLEKFCIPAPVVGGLIFAILHTVLKLNGVLEFNLDTTLQKPFMMVFFTTIGLGASIELIKKGGLQVLFFWLLASALCIFQDGIGIAISKAMNQNPFLGLLCGSVTMTGGHGTGAAFGELFQKQYGLNGALETAMAAATFGLVTGSLIGGPIGKRLIEGRNLKSNVSAAVEEAAADTVCESVDYQELFKTLALVLVSIGIGAILEGFFKRAGIVLPSYVNSMIIAAIILNIGESTGKWTVNQKCADVLGNIGLNTFLSMALIGLKLWELAAVAGPMLVILVAEAILMGAFAYFITFNVMGKDFDAAVLAAGHCGFGMGATPNGIANMDAVKEKYGPAPRAYFVLPVVGAFLIDFTNAVVITTFVNFIK